MRAAQRFFRSARSVAGFVPDRVTTDGHNSYPRAIRSTLGRNVRHRTSVYLTDIFDKPFLADPCYFRPARATAWQRAGVGM
jgi:transposase-like protein